MLALDQLKFSTNTTRAGKLLIRRPQILQVPLHLIMANDAVKIYRRKSQAIYANLLPFERVRDPIEELIVAVAVAARWFGSNQELRTRIMVYGEASVFIIYYTFNSCLYT